MQSGGVSAMHTEDLPLHAMSQLLHCIDVTCSSPNQADCHPAV
jgi:hypothetical protein